MKVKRSIMIFWKATATSAADLTSSATPFTPLTPGKRANSTFLQSTPTNWNLSAYLDT